MNDLRPEIFEGTFNITTLPPTDSWAWCARCQLQISLWPAQAPQRRAWGWLDIHRALDCPGSPEEQAQRFGRAIERMFR